MNATDFEILPWSGEYANWRQRRQRLRAARTSSGGCGCRHAAARHFAATPAFAFDDLMPAAPPPCDCRVCVGRRSRALGAFLPLEMEEELAFELLSVGSEAELDHFLGKIFRGIGRGLKAVGRFAGKVLKPLGGVLKKVAKAALPFVGRALGTLIPIPGVGTMIGGAIGSAVSKALEMELVGLNPEEAELEMARRFVRMAASATGQALQQPPDADPMTVAQDAVLQAARSQLGGGGGQWSRESGGLVVYDV